MISKKSIAPIILYYRFGYWTKALPWFWDFSKVWLLLPNKQAKPNPTEITWLKAHFIGQIVGRVSLVLLIMFTLALSHNVEPAEVIFGIFMSSLTLMATPLHVECFRNSPAIVEHMNSLFHIKRIAGTDTEWIHLSSNEKIVACGHSLSKVFSGEIQTSFYSIHKFLITDLPNRHTIYSKYFYSLLCISFQTKFLTNTQKTKMVWNIL